MKKFNLCIKLIAILPILSVVSLLLVATCFFLISLISSESQLNIVEILLIIIFSIYGVRLCFLLRNTKIKIISYFLISLTTTLIFYMTPYKPILLLQLVPVLYFVLNEEPIAIGLKRVIKKSNCTLFFFNVLDVCYMLFLYFLQHKEELVFNIFNDLLKKINIDTNINTVFAFLLGFLIFLLFPLFRSIVAINIYKQSNNITLDKGKTLWNKYFSYYLISLIIFSFSFTLIINYNDYGTMLLYSFIIFLIHSFLNSISWILYIEHTDLNNENKKDVIAAWVLIILLILSLIVFDKIENDSIGILTWFLPILIPSLIGGIDVLWQSESKSNLNSHTIDVKPTLKMRRHLYWLQMNIFNTLLTMNIIFSMFTNKVVSSDNIIREENIAKIHLKKFLINVMKIERQYDLILNLLSSFILILFSVIIALLLSKVICFLLRKTYLDPSKGYFN